MREKVVLALGTAQMGNRYLTSVSRLAKLFGGGELVLLRLFKWLKSSGLGSSFSIITNFAPCLAVVPLPGHWLP